MTETEKIMAEALERISKLAKSWEGRSDAPYWNLGDIATAALIKADSLKGSYICDCDGENGLHTPDCDVWIKPSV